MNYIKQINAFWKRIMLEDFTHAEISLYLAILQCANNSGWREEVRIPNSTLLTLSKLTSESQFHRTRKNLIESGFIRYEKGSKNISGTYVVVPLYESESNPAADCDTDYDTDCGSQNEAAAAAYINETEIYNENEIKSNSFKQNKTEAVSVVPQKIINDYESTIGAMTTGIRRSLAVWLTKVEEELISWAIAEAASRNRPKWSYVEGILRNCLSEGRINLAAVTEKRAGPYRCLPQSVYDDSDMDYNLIEGLFKASM